MRARPTNPTRGTFSACCERARKRPRQYRAEGNKTNELASPHCRPRGSGQGIVTAQTSTLEGSDLPQLWVKSGHFAVQSPCPLYPRKRTKLPRSNGGRGARETIGASVRLQEVVPRDYWANVRFTPESGHVHCTSSCPLCANSGHGRDLPLAGSTPVANNRHLERSFRPPHIELRTCLPQ